MSLGSYIVSGFRIFAFKKDAIKTIKDDPHAFSYGLLSSVCCILLSGLLAFIITFPAYAFGGSATGALISFMAVVAVCAFLMPALIDFFARLFKGKSSYKEYLPVSMIQLNVAMVVCPILFAAFLLFAVRSIAAGLILIWLLAVVFNIYSALVYAFAIRETYSLTTLNTFFTLLSAAVTGTIVYSILNLLWIFLSF